MTVSALVAPRPVCEPPPIHMPGAVQPHGALLAIDLATGTATHASTNLADFLEVDAAAALGRPVAQLLGEAIATLLPSALQSRRSNSGTAGLDAGLAGRRLRLLPFGSMSGTICVDILRESAAESGEPALVQAQRVIQALRLSRTSVGLCSIVVNEIRRITGFDRVMVYRFDEDGSGDIIAENRGPDIKSFLGLKYPASDIPQQARRLHMLQRMRIIPDVNADPRPLLAVSGHRPEDLDLSGCSVRAVSPCHLQYLRNMGVTATAVVSLVVGGRLWGMLVCHHNEPWMVNGDTRALLDLIGQVMSVMLGSLTELELGASRLQRQRALNVISTAVGRPDVSIGDALAAAASELINLVPADAAVATFADKTIAVGKTPSPEAFRAITDTLSAMMSDDLTATAVLPEIVSDPVATLNGFAGALMLPLPNCANGSLVWLRKELNLMVNWAGEPADATTDPVTGRLEPRKSFSTWQQEVRGRSDPWSEADLGAARDLRRILDEALVRRSEAELLKRLRDNDPLTGLPNRHAIESRLAAISASPTVPFTTLVMANLDGFRKCNDLLGHQAGDALLVQVAHRLNLIGAPNEMVARLGNDEFVILSSRATPEELAARVAGVFAQPFEVAKQVLHINASIGVADNAVMGTDLLRCGETAMRQAKTEGGNRISIYVQTLRDEAARQLLIERSLDAAMRSDRNQFHLVFQPIVAAATGALRSWEVLIRWQHPALGNIPPGVFIPIAESSGLIAVVGDYVLQEALRYLVELPPSAEAEEQEVYLSVNVSPLQLTRPGFAAEISAMLDARGLQPSRICIEITEGVFTNSVALATLMEIRKLGVLVAVDDFGIGYSSLSALQRLPADVVKLDRSFLPENDAPPTADRNFLGAVVALAHTAGLKVVVEGVETQAQLDAVILAGADAIQGYYVARPIPSETAVAMSCQSKTERTWHPKIEAAQRVRAGIHLAAPDPCHGPAVPAGQRRIDPADPSTSSETI